MLKQILPFLLAPFFGIVLNLRPQHPEMNPAPVLPGKDETKNTPTADTTVISSLFSEYIMYRESDPLKAMGCLLKAQSMAQNPGANDELAKILYHKGYLYRALGMYDLSIKSYLKSMKLYQAAGDSNLVAWLLLDIGNLYFNQKGKLPIAFEHYQRAFHAFQKLQNQEGVIVTTFNLGLTCRDKQDYALSIAYFLNALHLCEKSKDDYRQALALSYIGQVYMLQGNYAAARRYFDDSFRINREKKYKDGLAYSYDNYAALCQAEKNYDQALDNYTQSVHLYQEANDKYNIARAWQKISAIYDLKQDYSSAIKYAQLAFALADSNKLIAVQQEILPVIAGYYSRQQDYANAFKYLKKYTNSKESDIDTILNQTQTEYEMETARHQADTLKKENEWKDYEIQQQRRLIYFIFSGLLMVFILLALLFIRSQQLKRSNLHLFKKNVEIINKEKELHEIKKTNKYSGSQLSDRENQTLLNELMELINKEKIYLGTHLTLEDLAKKLNTNRTYLSQIINENFNTNFSNFINQYRVQEAQRMLLEGNNQLYTIESIANAAGFHSRTSFNTAFKKFVGLTPSDFIQMKNQPQSD